MSACTIAVSDPQKMVTMRQVIAHGMERNWVIDLAGLGFIHRAVAQVGGAAVITAKFCGLTLGVDAIDLSSVSVLIHVIDLDGDNGLAFTDLAGDADSAAD